jgi:mannose-6-phosphate isomerase-like protein (cupin superfamily)
VVPASSADAAPTDRLELERIGRVVTGRDERGRSTVEDERPGAVRVLGETIRYADLWSTAAAGAGASEAAAATIGPPAGGSCFRICELSPDPGAEGRRVGDPGGMHSTATIDYLMVLSGKLTMTLGDGSRRQLAPGDTVVQRGTEHAWTVPGPETCLLLAVMVAEPGR